MMYICCWIRGIRKTARMMDPSGLPGIGIDFDGRDAAGPHQSAVVCHSWFPSPMQS